MCHGLHNNLQKEEDILKFMEINSFTMFLFHEKKNVVSKCYCKPEKKTTISKRLIVL